MTDEEKEKKVELTKVDSTAGIIPEILRYGDLGEYTAEERGIRIYRVMEKSQSAIIRVPEWWANQNLGTWTNIIAAHIDRESDNAYHLHSATNAEPLIKHTDTESEQGINMFTNWRHNMKPVTEDEWLAKSLIMYGFHGDYMMPKDSAIGQIDEGGSWEWWQGSPEEADIRVGQNFKETVEQEDGPPMELDKIKLHFDYDEDLIDDMKELLSWEKTHRRYNDNEGAWTVDLDSIRDVIDILGEAGYTIAIDNTNGRLDLDRSDASFGLWFELPGRGDDSLASNSY